MAVVIVVVVENVIIIVILVAIAIAIALHPPAAADSRRQCRHRSAAGRDGKRRYSNKEEEGATTVPVFAESAMTTVLADAPLIHCDAGGK